MLSQNLELFPLHFVLGLLKIPIQVGGERATRSFSFHAFEAVLYST